MQSILLKLVGKIDEISERLLTLEEKEYKTPSKASKEPAEFTLDDLDFYEENPMLPKTPATRRTTMLARNIAAAEAESVRLVMQQTQPDFSHIHLTYLSVKSVSAFSSAYSAYELVHGIKLGVQTRVSETVMTQILARTKGLTEVQYHTMSNEVLLELLRRLVMPKSKLEFREQLIRNIDFEVPSSFKHSAADFKPFYNALLLYQKVFLRFYEVMAPNNMENIPDCKNKEGGLIKIFIDKIPYEFGTRTYQTLADTRFNDIYAFLKAFYEKVELNRQRHQGFLDLKQTFAPAFNKKSASALSNMVHEKSTPDLEEWPTQCSAEAEDSSLPDLDRSDDEEEFAGDFAAMAAPTPAPRLEVVAAMRAPPQASRAHQDNSQREPLACFAKLLQGKCTKAGCNFSHDEAVISKTRESYIRMMQERQRESGKPNVLRRPHTGNLSHIAPAEVPGVEQHVEDLFLANMPAHFFVRSVHRDGKVLLDDGSLPVTNVLFDTGAITASYISEDYVKTHRAQLEPYLQPTRGRVRLAAENHEVQVRELALLTVVFRDTKDRDHTAKVRFYVLPGASNDMVIGCPAIIGCFGRLFMQMLQVAMDEYAGQPSMSLSGVDEELRTPWSIPPEEDAPEDAQTEIPCSFPGPLHFMEMSVEDARKEFFSQIDAHVAPEFRAATRIDELLRTKGVQVFVPTNWEGIKHIEPLELEWKPDLPERLKPKARPVNPKLYEHTHKEFQRLAGYFYTPSRSPIASCLVVAPKATAPFIRICGDYVTVNKYIATGHFPIPHVQRSLEKICGFKIFMDIDLPNAFHQVPLGPITSERLSVQTPWGQVAPKFMPEGVAPATFILQETVSKIFLDFDEWLIVIFDNILVLAHDYDDAYGKLEIILDRCLEYNLYLKFAKSWLGFRKVHFFGYDCTHNSYALSDSRKKTLQDFKPPPNLKQLQSFLGAALYFKSFVPHYSTLAAPLNEMTKQDFPWIPPPWIPALVQAFERFKKALADAFAIFYPDYSLPWVLRTDASLEGVGMALFQIYRADANAEPQYQPIMFASQKFSKQARNWTTIEQECFGIYFGVQTCAYYLRCKDFVLETDHANLQWIEQSSVPKVMRWRVYLQSFSFSLRHIPGKQNLVADWLSRAHDEDDRADLVQAQPTVLANFAQLMDQSDAPEESEGDVQHLQIAHFKPPELPADFSLEDLLAPPATAALDPAAATEAALPSAPKRTPEELLAQVHGQRMGHHGARKTWKALNEHFPGHRVPYRVVEEFVAACPTCQKDRLGMTEALQPVYRSLKPSHKRKMVGVDTLTVTPPDKWGNQYINVVVVHATKLVGLYPSAHKSAKDMALALFRFFATYGVYECLISDPGSDLTSEVVEHLTAWYGIRHVFSLVNRHESNGVEGTNKSVLRHLRALVSDERVRDRWSDPAVLCLVQYMLNSQVSHETGVVPYHAHFGTEDGTYLRLPEPSTPAANTQEFVRLLDEDLRLIWDISRRHQSELADKRGVNDDPALQNQYQPGDLVLLQRDPQAPLPEKLSFRYMGPYEVIAQSKNDVTCRHLCVKTVHTFHVERLKIFSGTRADAERVAQLDHDQHEIADILYYRGDPEARRSMDFYVRFADGDEKWVPWSKDLFDSVPYETFCRSRPALAPLIYNTQEAQQRMVKINSTPITEVQPGQAVYVDLRSRGNAAWYHSIGLPDPDRLTYVLPCIYQRWLGRQQRKLQLSCEVTKEVFPVDHYFVQRYGLVTIFNPQTMVKVDQALCKKFPQILPQ